MQNATQEPKLYILIRDDLSKSQKIVQAVHAASSYLLEIGNNIYWGESLAWENGTVVCLKVKDEDMLLEEERKLIDMKAPYSVFTEPDLNNSKTAIALLSKNNLFPNLFLI